MVVLTCESQVFPVADGVVAVMARCAVEEDNSHVVEVKGTRARTRADIKVCASPRDAGAVTPLLWELATTGGLACVQDMVLPWIGDEDGVLEVQSHDDNTMLVICSNGECVVVVPPCVWFP